MTDEEPKFYAVEEACRSLGVTAGEIADYIDEGLVVLEKDEHGAEGFSRVQMRRLWSIVSLHRDLGINLPGVAAVLRLREQYEQMRRDMQMLVEIVERELGEDVWDRIWPKGRPRPGVQVSVGGSEELPHAAKEPEDGADKPPVGEGT